MNPTVRHSLREPEYQLALLGILEDRVTSGSAWIQPNQAAWGPVAICGQPDGRMVLTVEDAVAEVDNALQAEAESLLRRTWALSHMA